MIGSLTRISLGILTVFHLATGIGQLFKVHLALHELREVLPKKVAVLLDFVQLRGGRALPKFFVHFSQTVYIGSIWGWGGRGRPLPKFFGTLAFKKVVQVVQIWGGGRGKWGKNQKKSYFFS